MKKNLAFLAAALAFAAAQLQAEVSPVSKPFPPFALLLHGPCDQPASGSMVNFYFFVDVPYGALPHSFSFLYSMTMTAVRSSSNHS